MGDACFRWNRNIWQSLGHTLPTRPLAIRLIKGYWMAGNSNIYFTSAPIWGPGDGDSLLVDSRRHHSIKDVHHPRWLLIDWTNLYQMMQFEWTFQPFLHMSDIFTKPTPLCPPSTQLSNKPRLIPQVPWFLKYIAYLCMWFILQVTHTCHSICSRIDNMHKQVDYTIIGVSGMKLTGLWAERMINTMVMVWWRYQMWLEAGVNFSLRQHRLNDFNRIMNYGLLPVDWTTDLSYQEVHVVNYHL